MLLAQLYPEALNPPLLDNQVQPDPNQYYVADEYRQAALYKQYPDEV